MYIQTSLKSEPIEVDCIYLSTRKIQDKLDNVYSLMETPTGEIKLIKYGKGNLSIHPSSHNSIEIK